MSILEEYNEIYKMNAVKEKYMVESGIIVFDTNVICKLYRYTDDSLNIFFRDICTKFKDRLWLPGRVKYEFLKNREKIINSQINNITILKQNISNIDMVKDFSIRKEAFLQKYDNDIGLKQEDFNELDSIGDKYSKSFDKLKQKFHRTSNERIKKLQELINMDNIFLEIEKNFNIGNDYNADWEKQNLEHLEKRFLNQMSPGYQDNEKKGIDKYGDCILWLQIMEYAKSVKKDIIFVTDDNKEDWINIKSKDNIITPKNDLLKEFYDVTNQKFWIYDINGFWNLIKDKFGINIEKLITEDNEIQNKNDFYDRDKIEYYMKMIKEINEANEKRELNREQNEIINRQFNELYKQERDNYIKNRNMTRHSSTICERSDERDNINIRRLGEQYVRNLLKKEKERDNYFLNNNIDIKEDDFVEK